jgi:hypothetical protein
VVLISYLRNQPGSQAPVTHARNPSYSGGRDQEDHYLKPGREDSSRDSILKNTQKRAGGVAQAIEHLPSKCEALSSTVGTVLQKKKKKKKKKKLQK